MDTNNMCWVKLVKFFLYDNNDKGLILNMHIFVKTIQLIFDFVLDTPLKIDIIKLQD